MSTTTQTETVSLSDIKIGDRIQFADSPDTYSVGIVKETDEARTYFRAFNKYTGTETVESRHVLAKFTERGWREVAR